MTLSRFRSCRTVPVLGFAVLLAGCADRPCALVSPAPSVMDAAIDTAAHAAYRHGFEAGRDYQHRLDMKLPAVAKAAEIKNETDATSQEPVSKSPPASAPGAPQPGAPSTAPSPDPVPPSANYTTSGPAQPLR
ncbi:hypothetical protein [Acidocella sp.]|uniref:hypothetical protein n=1 Tax=Acidocella sp. TaxID=50710 RepID=UPI00261502D1|nr:hypothetical protein [Acidocella sp.]